MFTGPLEDRVAIRELLERYGDAVCRHNADDWGACWAEDATWSLMGNVMEGREQIVTVWKQAMGALEAVSFMTTPAAIEVDGDRATGRTQTHEILLSPDGSSRFVGGLYDDEFVKRDGAWFFAKRVYAIIAEYGAKEEVVS